MKTTVSLNRFDLQGLLVAVADFSDNVCGEQFQAATMATEAERDELYRGRQDWNDLPRFERGERFAQLERKVRAGETLVLDIAEPNVGEPISFADGKKYAPGEDDEVPGGEADSCVIFIDYSPQTGDLTIETGMQCSGGCMCPPTLELGPIGFLEKPAEEFVRRFINQ